MLGEVGNRGSGQGGLKGKFPPVLSMLLQTLNLFETLSKRKRKIVNKPGDVSKIETKFTPREHHLDTIQQK